MRSIIAGDVMTPEILKVDEATSVAELANFLINNEISGAIVVNPDGDPVGVVSATDIVAVAALAGESMEHRARRRGFYSDWANALDESDVQGMSLDEHGATVGEIMTPEVFSVAVDTPASEIARLMCDSHLHRVLVTDNDDFVGIITTSDLLGLLVDEGD